MLPEEKSLLSTLKKLSLPEYGPPIKLRMELVKLSNGKEGEKEYARMNNQATNDRMLNGNRITLLEEDDSKKRVEEILAKELRRKKRREGIWEKEREEEREESKERRKKKRIKNNKERQEKESKEKQKNVMDTRISGISSSRNKRINIRKKEESKEKKSKMNNQIDTSNNNVRITRSSRPEDKEENCRREEIHKVNSRIDTRKKNIRINRSIRSDEKGKEYSREKESKVTSLVDARNNNIRINKSSSSDGNARKYTGERDTVSSLTVTKNNNARISTSSGSNDKDENYSRQKEAKVISLIDERNNNVGKSKSKGSRLEYHDKRYSKEKEGKMRSVVDTRNSNLIISRRSNAKEKTDNTENEPKVMGKTKMEPFDNTRLRSAVSNHNGRNDANKIIKYSSTTEKVGPKKSKQRNGTLQKKIKDDKIKDKKRMSIVNKARMGTTKSNCRRQSESRKISKSLNTTENERELLIIREKHTKRVKMVNNERMSVVDKTKENSTNKNLTKTVDKDNLNGSSLNEERMNMAGNLTKRMLDRNSIIRSEHDKNMKHTSVLEEEKDLRRTSITPVKERRELQTVVKEWIKINDEKIAGAVNGEDMKTGKSKSRIKRNETTSVSKIAKDVNSIEIQRQSSSEPLGPSPNTLTRHPPIGIKGKDEEKCKLRRKTSYNEDPKNVLTMTDDPRSIINSPEIETRYSDVDSSDTSIKDAGKDKTDTLNSDLTEGQTMEDEIIKVYDQGNDQVKEGVQRTRSGRRCMPVMEWWRCERVIVDAKGRSIKIDGTPKTDISSKRRARTVKPLMEKRSQVKSVKTKTIRKVDLPSASSRRIDFSMIPTDKVADDKVLSERKEDKKPRHISDTIKSDTSLPKIAGRKTQKFKRQVREFVRETEKKTKDDIFEDKKLSLKCQSEPFKGIKIDDVLFSNIALPEPRDVSDSLGEQGNRKRKRKMDDRLSSPLFPTVDEKRRCLADSYIKQLQDRRKANEKLLLNTIRNDSKTKMKSRNNADLAAETTINGITVRAAINSSGCPVVSMEGLSDDSVCVSSNDEEEEEEDLCMY